MTALPLFQISDLNDFGRMRIPFGCKLYLLLNMSLRFLNSWSGCKLLCQEPLTVR